MLTLLRVRRVARLRRRPGSSTALPARFEERAPGSLLFHFGMLPLRSVPRDERTIELGHIDLQTRIWGSGVRISSGAPSQQYDGSSFLSADLNQPQTKISV